MRSKKSLPIGQGCKCTVYGVKSGHTFRSDKCAVHTDMFLHRCMGCGDLFHSDMPHTKTCSDKCRKRLSRMRHDKMFQTVLQFANGGD